MQLKELELGKLRFAYMTVKQFLESESGEKVNSKTRIAADLSLLGDDNLDLLERFVKKFELDHRGFEYDKHFHSEAELYDSYAVLYNLLTVSIWLPLKTIELLTLNSLKLDKPKFYKPERPVTDMTFKDLITWYLEGSYSTSEQLKYRIKST